MNDVDEQELLDEYVEGAVGWGRLISSDYQKANQLFDRLHAIAQVLKASTSGRDGLIGLARHDEVVVRSLAATECLAVDPGIAVSVLETIRDADLGIHSFNAKYTLKEFFDGGRNLEP